MSFSFSVRAATAALAIAAVHAELAKVVARDPAHAVDLEPAKAVAACYVGLLTPDDTRDVRVDMHGSIGYRGDGPGRTYSSTGIGVSAWLVTREPPPAG